MSGIEEGGIALVVQDKPAVQRSILDLPQLVENLPHDEQSVFKKLFTLINSESPLDYPSPAAQAHVAEVFHVSPDYIEKRRTLRVINEVWGEETSFNPIRANRPIQRDSNGQVDKLAEKNPIDECDLCAAKLWTPQDIFGRIETEESITNANTGAYEAEHDLIIPKDKHNPSQVDESSIQDILEVAKKYFLTAYKYNPRAIYPFMIANVLPRAGASLFHFHLQAMLAQERPYKRTEQLRNAMAFHQFVSGHPYLDDLAFCLEPLGLVQQIGSARIIFNIAPKKEKEVIIYAKDEGGMPNGDISRAVSEMIEWWRSIGVTSYNMAFYMPPLEFDGDNRWHNFPLFVRMLDRGSEDTRTSDIGAMELYGPSVVSSDPFKLASSFAKSLKKRVAV